MVLRVRLLELSATFVPCPDETFEISPMSSSAEETFLATPNTLEFQDVTIENIYVVRRVKLPNFMQEHELDIPEDDEGMTFLGNP